MLVECLTFSLASSVDESLAQRKRPGYLCVFFVVLYVQERGYIHIEMYGLAIGGQAPGMFVCMMA